MSVDFSQMTADEIKALLEQRRAEVNSLQKVAKEKGISTPSEAKYPKTLVALRQATRRFSKAERDFEEQRASFEAARSTRDEAISTYLAEIQAEAIPADVQAMLDELYQESKKKLPGTKKVDPGAEPEAEPAVEAEAAAD